MMLFCLILSNCKQKTTDPVTKETDTEQAVDTLPDDFVEFYDRFHSDSAYQVSRILFPLEGLPNSETDTDTVPTERFFWQRDEWVIHNKFMDPSGQFDHWFEVIDPRLIEHWVNLKGTNMVIHRRFAKTNDGWYLIYYAGMRPHSSQ
jgi:hypothetical protein